MISKDIFYGIAPYIWSLLGFLFVFRDTYADNFQAQKIKKFLYIVLYATPTWEIVGVIILYFVQKNYLFNLDITYERTYIVTTFLYSILFVAPIPLQAYLFSKKFGSSFSTALISYLMMFATESLAHFIGKTPLSSLIVYILASLYCFLMTRKYISFLAEHKTSRKSTSAVIFFASVCFIITSLYELDIYRTYSDTYYSNTEVVWYYFIAVLVFLAMVFFHRTDIKYHQYSILRENEAREKEKYIERYTQAQYETIQSLAEISEAKSGETGKHIQRVSEYTVILAKALGVDEKQLQILKTASMLHDVGKLLIPNEILEKPGKLTDEEFKVIKTHTTYGLDLLKNSKGPIMQFARIIAYEHHEKWNGTGYPQGLKKHHIHLYAQIVSVADVFDALTSKRCYKEAWPIDKARQEIISLSGISFSPEVVDAFDKNFDAFRIVYEQNKDTGE